MIIHVKGGPYDGLVADTTSDDAGEKFFAEKFSTFAGEERTGKSFMTLSPLGIQTLPSIAAYFKKHGKNPTGLEISHKYTQTAFETINGVHHAKFTYASGTVET